MSKYKIKVVAIVDESVHEFIFEGEGHSSSQMWDGGKANITMANGRDEKGRVSDALFRRTEVIIRYDES